MKFKCGKCGEEFDARMYVKCPKCGEIRDVRVIYEHYHKPKEEAPEHVEAPQPAEAPVHGK